MTPIDKTAWIESMMRQMSPEARIAQLLHVPAWSNRNEAHEAELLELVEKYQIGGIIFFQGTAQKQAEMTNRLQAAAKVPLFISIDGEWGLAMRLDETLAFPYAMTLGAINDDELIYDCGKAIGRHCRRLGIHINHAPVVDINTEPDNPVIGFRAFGSDPQRVAQKAVAFLKGQQDAGVMAVAKHFPGHGDTSVDSHLALPLVEHDLKRFREWEWFPFQQAFDAGVGGVMVAHLAVPALEDDEQLPASLSPAVIQGFLQKELGFEGLVFSDALNMKGATGRYAQGEGDMVAVKAGHDILIYVEDVPAAVASIQEAVGRGEISQTEIDRKVRKQLAAKFDAGLAEAMPIELSQLEEDLHTEEDKQLIEQLFEAAATVQIHSVGMLPLGESDNVSFVMLGTDHQDFWKAHFPQASFFHLSEEASDDEVETLFSQVGNPEKVVVVMHGLSQKAGVSFGLQTNLQSVANRLLNDFPSMLVLPGNPYVLRRLEIEGADTVLTVFDDREAAWRAAVNILKGNTEAHGSLPVSLS